VNVLSLTEEDEQTHADGEDGAGAEGGEAVTFDRSQLAALPPESVEAAAAKRVGRQRLAHAGVTTGSDSAGRRRAPLLPRGLRHRQLTAGAPGRTPETGLLPSRFTLKVSYYTIFRHRL